MQVHEALKRASSFLKEKGREPQAAEILLRHHLHVTRTKLFQMMQDDFQTDKFARFSADIEAHARGVPVQHLTGEEEFYGRRFEVNGDVLIPRPETEELVADVLDKVKSRFPGEESIRVVDIGTGSGAIAATLALEEPQLLVSAVDISEKALAVAERNANRLGANLIFYQGDLLSPLIESGDKADVIVANPPYISNEDVDRLDSLVKDHEPRLALSGGDDGFDIYRRLIRQLPQVLNKPGYVAFEVGVGQSVEVASMLKEVFQGDAEISIKEDINGKDRIVTAEIG
ncbi:MAG TPA: peptide chain release factor N(5)-glutamine methyltransferase [Bacillales bacterium]